MKEEIFKLIITNSCEIIFALLGVVITVYIIPWLKEKKLYDKVKMATRAAEKLAQSCEIDKLQWVKDKLALSGIKITPTIECMIESSVEELDTLLAKIKE